MVDLPIGSIVMFDGVTPPVGWYDCDGYTRGGITTPNLIGVFPRGVLASGGSLGATGGSEIHSHTNADSGYATHGHDAVSGNSGVSSGSDVPNIWAGGSIGLGEHQHLISVAAASNQASHKHTIPNTNSGSSLPPYIRLRYIMRCE